MAISALESSQSRPIAEPLSSAPKTDAEALDETPSTGGHAKAFAGEEFSFWDLVDIINPLQHIPVVSTLYRHVTGDEIGFVAKLAGGALMGGALGLAGSFIDVAIEDNSGADIGEHVYAFLTGEEVDTGETALAKKDSPAETGAETLVARSDSDPEPAPQAAPMVAVSEESLPPLAPPLAPAPELAPSNRPAFGLALPESAAPEQLAAVPPPSEALRPLVARTEPRFMPLPQRGVPSAPRVNSNTHSTLLEAQTAASASTSASPSATRQPTLPPASPQGLENAGASGAWFGAAMGSALSKYEQARKLQTPPPGN